MRVGVHVLRAKISPPLAVPPSVSVFVSVSVSDYIDTVHFHRRFVASSA